jgi:hypothetical protein
LVENDPVRVQFWEDYLYSEVGKLIIRVEYTAYVEVEEAVREEQFGVG